MLQAYYEVMQIRDSPNELAEHFRRRNISLGDARGMLLSHAELRLPDVFTFTPESIAERLRIPDSDVATALQAVSLPLGSLAATDPEDLFLNNPVWMKPVIALDHGLFFCALPQLFFSFVFRIMDSLLSASPPAKTECADRRAAYLPTRAAAILRKALPDGP